MQNAALITFFKVNLKTCLSSERKLCCPEGFTEVGDGCFLFQDDEVNNMQALELCSFHNEGSLAKIDPLVPVTVRYLI